jgi:hypothetical protein
MKIYLLVLFTVLGLNSCAAASPTTTASTDEELRTVLCKIENGDYANAQAELEKILQREPENVYAPRLLPGVLAQQIKDDDKSPPNIARIRKTIEAYREYLKKPQISVEEKTAADDFVINLYEKLGEEEKSAELLKRIDDKSYSAKDRGRFYALLADSPRKCADQIFYSLPSLKAPEKSEIGKAKACVAKGLEYVKQAIALDADSEWAWLNQASLLNLASKIAESENNQNQKNLLKKQAAAASIRWRELSDKRFNEMPKIPAGELSKTDGFSKDTISRELIEYKAQKPLDLFIKEIYVPSALIVPLPVDDEPSDKDSAPAVEKPDKQKREWKPFAPADDEISVELPDNVSTERYGVFSETSEQYEAFRRTLQNLKGKGAETGAATGETIIYTADSEGLKFMILSQPKPSFQDSTLDDVVHNTLAWAFVKPKVNLWNRTAGDSVEIKLLKKEAVGGQPGRIYTYTLGSCAGKTDGSFMTLIGKGRNYVIDAQGAAFSDGRVQRFIKSLRIVERK